MSDSFTARVGIVDHQPLALLGARTVLDAHPDLVVRASVSEREDALALLERDDLDLLLVDADHPDLDFEELLLRERSMRILLTSDRHRGNRIELRDSHLVLGFVSKRSHPSRFSALVFEAAAGVRPGPVLPRGAAHGLRETRGDSGPASSRLPGGDGAPPAI